jgi:hypothetical protein
MAALRFAIAPKEAGAYEMLYYCSSNVDELGLRGGYIFLFHDFVM